MKITNLIIATLALAFLSQCTISNQTTSKSNSSVKDRSAERKTENGECLAKCIAPNRYAVESQEFAVYTGDEKFEDVNLATKRIVIKPSSSEWVKKKADRNCVSADPNDCLVWCLVETPPVVKEFKILKDTTQSPNFRMEKINSETLVEKGGHTTWEKVICKENITPLIIAQVQNALRENEYYQAENSTTMDSVTKSALTKFQKEHQLPVGQLDYATLDALGIVY